MLCLRFLCAHYSSDSVGTPETCSEVLLLWLLLLEIWRAIRDICCIRPEGKPNSLIWKRYFDQWMAMNDS